MSPPDIDLEGSDDPGRRFNFNTVFGIVFVIASVILFVITPEQITWPKIVISANENALEPTLFPQLISAGMGMLGLWLFFKSFSIVESNLLKALDRDAIINVAVVFAVMAAYGPLMIQIGFVASGALVIGFLSTFFGNRDYALTAIVSVAVPVTVFYVFTRLLATYLPPFPIDTVLTRYSIL